MKKLGITGGVLGILFSLVCQLFAITDDAYALGNIWFLGVLSGILAIIGANRLDGKSGVPIVIISCLLGFCSIFYFYTIPAIVCLAPVLNKITEKKDRLG